MFPDLSKIIPVFENGLKQVYDVLCHLYAETKASREAAQSQQRSMAFEFGVVDSTDSNLIAPRRLTNLPVIVEETTTERDEVDVAGENHGVAVSRGFYANLGDAPFKVTLIGVNGQASVSHTVPPSTTISLTCLITRVIIDPTDEGPAFYQLYMQ